MDQKINTKKKKKKEGEPVVKRKRLVKGQQASDCGF